MSRITQHIYRLFILALFIAFLFVTPSLAQEATPIIPDDEVNAVAKDMYCPVCENVPLDVCPTQACAQWRELIRQRLAEGWSDQEIKDYFVAQYGDRVLAEPPRTGFNWLVYVIPPLVVVAGVVIVVRVLRSWRLQTAHANGTFPTIDDDYVRRLEAELERRNR